MTFRRFLVGASAIALLIAIQLWIFLPVVPRSALGWGVLVILGLPASLFIEWLGEAALDRQSFHRLSGPARILVAAPVALVLVAVTWAAVWGVRLAVAAA